MEPIDLGALFFFRQQLARPWLDELMKVLTHAGDTVTLVTVAVLATVLFLLAKRPRLAMVIALSSILGFTVESTVKQIVERPRPEPANAAVERPTSFSFPSGHATNSMAIYGSIGVAAAGLVRRQRRLILLVAFLLPLVIGFTRMYLGVHYLFDVVAGWTAGLACVCFAFGMERAFFGGKVEVRPVLHATIDAPEKSDAPVSDGIRPALGDIRE
jgi:undecaprenyl-diphosphatase